MSRGARRQDIERLRRCRFADTKAAGGEGAPECAVAFACAQCCICLEDYEVCLRSSAPRLPRASPSVLLVSCTCLLCWARGDRWRQSCFTKVLSVSGVAGDVMGDGGGQDDDELRGLPCGHGFHVSCIDRWLLDNRACPFCKNNVC